MSDLGSLPGALWDFTKSVLKEMLLVVAVPRTFKLYREAVGAPEVPDGLLQQLKTLSEREADAEVLADAAECLDGIAEAWALGDQAPPDEDWKERLSRAWEILERFFLPFVIVCMRRDPRWRYWSFVPVLLAMADDHLARQLPEPFLATRIAKAIQRGWAQFGEDQDAALFKIAYAGYGGLLLLDALYKWRVQDSLLSTHNWEHLIALGWESDLAQYKIGVTEPPRPLPVWMAQRTLSIRWEEKQKRLKLTDYDTADMANHSRSNAPMFGVTMVPIPTSAGGPAVYVQLDGEETIGDHDFGGGWRGRIRGEADAGVRIALTGAPTVTSGRGIALELAYSRTVEPPPLDETTRGGSEGGVSFSVGGLALVGFAGGSVTTGTPPAAGDDIGAALRISNARLSITPKSAVLSELIKRSISVSLDAGLLFTYRHGFVLEGSGGLELYLALRKQLGNRWAGVDLSYMRIALGYKSGEHGAELTGTVTFGLSFNFARITLTLDGIGAQMALDTGRDHRRGNLLRIANFAGDVVMPKGYALRIDWGAIRGGGFFSYDAALQRFAGALELRLTSELVLSGVGFTEPREGGGTTTVLTAMFDREVLNPTWDLTGVGVLVGLHRRADINAIRDALPSGALDALMFPDDPLGRANELVAALASMFPQAAPDDDTHVVGVMLRFAILRGRADAKLALIGEWGGSLVPRKVILAASIKSTFPKAIERVIRIEAVGLGIYDPATGELELRAALRNSRLFGGELEGGLVIFRGDPNPDDGDPDRGVFVSVGGYHPSYFGGQGPLRARVDKRLRVVFERGNAIRAEVSIYFAVTPGAVHFGLRGQLEVHAGGFGLLGKAWLDGLVIGMFDGADIELGGELDLILFDRTVSSLALKGRLTGPLPWRICGSVSFKVLWWSVSKCFDKTLSEEISQVEQTIDLRAEMLALVRNPASYTAQQPGLIALRAGSRSGIWNAPEQPLRFFQKYAPLETPIDRVGTTPLGGASSVALGPVTIGGTSGRPPLVVGEFAPGLYLSLDKNAALNAPVAEHWPAGFDAAGDAVGGGDAVAAIAEYDEIIIDRDHHEPPAPPPKRVLPHAVLAALAEAAPVQPHRPIRIAPPTYGLRGERVSFAAAWAARLGHVRRDEVQ